MNIMKKFLAVVLIGSLLVACGNKGDNKKVKSDTKKVAFVTNTSVGDNSLADVMWSGVQKAAEDFNLEAKVVELKEDATKQVPTLQELAESEEYEIIVAGTWNLKESIETVAAEFPDQLFLSPDVEMEYDGGKNKNIVSFLSAQNEGAFLGGALAAMLTVCGHEYTNQDKTIGFVAGGENSGINDFLVGYIEGAKYVDPETKVLFSYIGDFTNSAKAKELTLAQYSQGADIVFGVAAQAGFGVLSASAEQNKFSMGVDMDQGLVLAKNNPTEADHVVTSVQKNLDITVRDLIGQHLEGKLEFGQHLVIGVKENGMSLSDNDIYKKHVSKEILDEIAKIEEKISNGEIVVSSAIGMSTEEVNKFKELAGN